MDHKEVALSAAFMGMGYATASIKCLQNLGRTPHVSGWGQLETVAFLTKAAEQLEVLYCFLPEDLRDSAPGVWAYEVAEPIGVWFGEQVSNGGIPSKREMSAFMIERIADFFTQCDGADRPETKAALLDLLNGAQKISDGIDDQVDSDVESRVQRLSVRFSELLREGLSAVEMAEVLSKNANEQNAQVCHTHDFLDANQVMLDAIADLGFRDLDLAEPLSDASIALWNAAWNLAKSNNFYCQTPAK